jgi:dTDP-4-amino-4,6-dideoxygalactose transaminase
MSPIVQYQKRVNASKPKRIVPYVNIAGQHVEIKKEILNAIECVIDRGDFILGKEVSKFETLFAELCGTKYAISLASGTDALVLAMKALGIGLDDEVITVPNTFISTVSAIVLVGARPVLVDVKEDGNIDPEKVEELITVKTRAIIPVHLTGKPAEMDSILAIARKRKIAVIEDAAQAVTATFRGTPVGSLGDCGCFSLHPLKTLNALGDAGVVTTNDGKLAARVKKLRNLGLTSRDNCDEWSGHSRLDTIQAASLIVKLKYVKKYTEKRRQNVERYRNLLSGLTEIECPQEEPSERSVYHTFVIRTEKRDELQKYLTTYGIGTAVHYPIPIHLQSVTKRLGYGKGSFPSAEKLAETILSLPIYPELEEDDLNYVSEHIHSFYESRKR